MSDDDGPPALLSDDCDAGEDEDENDGEEDGPPALDDSDESDDSDGGGSDGDDGFYPTVLYGGPPELVAPSGEDSDSDGGRDSDSDSDSDDGPPPLADQSDNGDDNGDDSGDDVPPGLVASEDEADGNPEPNLNGMFDPDDEDLDGDGPPALLDGDSGDDDDDDPPSLVSDDDNDDEDDDDSSDVDGGDVTESSFGLGMQRGLAQGFSKNPKKATNKKDRRKQNVGGNYTDDDEPEDKTKSRKKVKKKSKKNKLKREKRAKRNGEKPKKEQSKKDDGPPDMCTDDSGTDGAGTDNDMPGLAGGSSEGNGDSSSDDDDDTDDDDEDQTVKINEKFEESNINDTEDKSADINKMKEQKAVAAATEKRRKLDEKIREQEIRRKERASERLRIDEKRKIKKAEKKARMEKARKFRKEKQEKVEEEEDTLLQKMYRQRQVEEEKRNADVDIQNMVENIGKCRYPKCHTINRVIRGVDKWYYVECTEACRISYHDKCYKRVSRNHEYQIAFGAPCVTPDCTGDLFKVEFMEGKSKQKEIVKIPDEFVKPKKQHSQQKKKKKKGKGKKQDVEEVEEHKDDAAEEGEKEKKDDNKKRKAVRIVPRGNSDVSPKTACLYPGCCNAKIIPATPFCQTHEKTIGSGQICKVSGDSILEVINVMTYPKKQFSNINCADEFGKVHVIPCFLLKDLNDKWDGHVGFYNVESAKFAVFRDNTTFQKITASVWCSWNAKMRNLEFYNTRGKALDARVNPMYIRQFKGTGRAKPSEAAQKRAITEKKKAAKEEAERKVQNQLKEQQVKLVEEGVHLEFKGRLVPKKNNVEEKKEAAPTKKRNRRRKKKPQKLDLITFQELDIDQEQHKPDEDEIDMDELQRSELGAIPWTASIPTTIFKTCQLLIANPLGNQTINSVAQKCHLYGKCVVQLITIEDRADFGIVAFVVFNDIDQAENCKLIMAGENAFKNIEYIDVDRPFRVQTPKTRPAGLAFMKEEDDEFPELPDLQSRSEYASNYGHGADVPSLERVPENGKQKINSDGYTDRNGVYVYSRQALHGEPALLDANLNPIYKDVETFAPDSADAKRWEQERENDYAEAFAAGFERKFDEGGESSSDEEGEGADSDYESEDENLSPQERKQQRLLNMVKFGTRLFETVPGVTSRATRTVAVLRIHKSHKIDVLQEMFVPYGKVTATEIDSEKDGRCAFMQYENLRQAVNVCQVLSNNLNLEFVEDWFAIPYVSAHQIALDDAEEFPSLGGKRSKPRPRLPMVHSPVVQTFGENVSFLDQQEQIFNKIKRPAQRSQPRSQLPVRHQPPHHARTSPPRRPQPLQRPPPQQMRASPPLRSQPQPPRRSQPQPPRRSQPQPPRRSQPQPPRRSTTQPRMQPVFQRDQPSAQPPQRSQPQSHQASGGLDLNAQEFRPYVRAPPHRPQPESRVPNEYSPHVSQDSHSQLNGGRERGYIPHRMQPPPVRYPPPPRDQPPPDRGPFSARAQPPPPRAQPRPARNQQVPERDQPFPARGQPSPARGQHFPIPARGQPLPDRRQPLPVRDQPLPDRRQPLPARDQPLPARHQPLPARDQHLPAVSRDRHPPTGVQPPRFVQSVQPPVFAQMESSTRSRSRESGSPPLEFPAHSPQMPADRQPQMHQRVQQRPASSDQRNPAQDVGLSSHRPKQTSAARFSDDSLSSDDSDSLESCSDLDALLNSGEQPEGLPTQHLAARGQRSQPNSGIQSREGQQNLGQREGPNRGEPHKIPTDRASVISSTTSSTTETGSMGGEGEQPVAHNNPKIPETRTNEQIKARMDKNRAELPKYHDQPSGPYSRSTYDRQGAPYDRQGAPHDRQGAPHDRQGVSHGHYAQNSYGSQNEPSQYPDGYSSRDYSYGDRDRSYQGRSGSRPSGYSAAPSGYYQDSSHGPRSASPYEGRVPPRHRKSPDRRNQYRSRHSHEYDYDRDGGGSRHGSSRDGGRERGLHDRKPMSRRGEGEDYEREYRNS